jgi:hypothetical protein
MDNRISRHIALLTGAALCTLAAATPAQARTTVIDQSFDGNVATAIFNSDPSACVQTSISISVIDGRGSSGAATLTVVVDEFDACTRTELGSGASQIALSAAQFAIDHKLAGASLAAAVPFFDFASGRALSLSLNLAWTASDGPVETRVTTRSTGPGGTLEMMRANGAFSDASVSGTPAYVGVSGPAFTLRTAQIGTSHDGTHIVSK